MQTSQLAPSLDPRGSRHSASLGPSDHREPAETPQGGRAVTQTAHWLMISH